MWSPGLLFLLWVCSCPPVARAPQTASPGEKQLNQEPHENQRRNVFKKLGIWLKEHFRGIGEVLIASLGQVPVAGPPIAGAIKTLLLITPEADPLDVVKSELKALDFKLNTFRSEMKWDAWAAGAYQMPVNNIEKAWIKYTELVRSQQTNTEKEEALKNNFFTFYSQYADSTLVLHQFLTAKPASITKNLGDLLADRLRCHEKDIDAQFLYLNKLICKGNLLDEKYYEFKGISTNARVNSAHTIASQSASALIALRLQCIIDSALYIEKDIFELIDDTRNHQELADSVSAFLAKTYARYDWMVVAFTTKNSKRNLSLLNRHVLLGFTEVEKGTVTVAVAKQVKGGHSMTAAVIKDIKECLPTGIKICSDVAKKLMECKEKRLSQKYTAVHTYKIKPQTSTNTPDDEDSALPESSVSLRDSRGLGHHVFTGKCGKLLGKFMVFIKSDEEIMESDPCSNVKCKHGKCAIVQGTFIATCLCEYPYYGEHCEESLESYKIKLQQDAESGTQTPEQFRKDSRRYQHYPRGRSARGQTKQNPGASRGSTDRRPRPSTSQGSADRRPRPSTSQGSADRRPRPSTSQGSVDRRSQQLPQSRPINPSSSQQTQRHLTRGRSNSVAPQGAIGKEMMI